MNGALEMQARFDIFTSVNIFWKNTCLKTGYPSKPVRLMVSLLLLKQIYNLGDETIVSAWVHNPYWQYFSGYSRFQWNFPIEPTDLVQFRKRIGKQGIE